MTEQEFRDEAAKRGLTVGEPMTVMDGRSAANPYIRDFKAVGSMYFEGTCVVCDGKITTCHESFDEAIARVVELRLADPIILAALLK